MPILYRSGDATSPQGDGQKIIVHVCNDIGGWGRGFVTAISKRWAEPEKQYRAWYRGEASQSFALGEVQFVRVAPDITVANLIGQQGIVTRQRNPSSPPVHYEAIRTGLAHVARYAEEHAASVHMPRIGCGLAGGRWEEIEPLIDDKLTSENIEVTVYDFL
jgi:O-acetyl-ADP-ribose deacetylase (regulator of RNase III)